MYKIKEISRKGKLYRDVLRSLIGNISRFGPGRHLAVKACLSNEDSKLVIAWFSTGRVAGASSYRRTTNSIKRINTGAVVRRRGIGSALIRFIILKNPKASHWSKNTPDGTKFCRKLGMRKIKQEQHLTWHKWTAKKALAWAKK